jgi:hypothetical protein
MKVIKPTTHLVDIGPLDHTMRLPMDKRIQLGMKTICDRCGKSITDEYFVVGFKQGHRNMMFHEACIEKGEQ